MKNQLYILAIVEGKDTSNNLPKWKVVAATQNYDLIEEDYKTLQSDRLLLDWSLTKGVRIVRANLEGCQMTSDFNNIDIAMDDLSGHHRAGLFLALYETVLDFIKS